MPLSRRLCFGTSPVRGDSVFIAPGRPARIILRSRIGCVNSLPAALKTFVDYALRATKTPAESIGLSGAFRRTFITQPSTPTGARILQRCQARALRLSEKAPGRAAA